MAQHNPVNERVKRQYFAYLKEAKRQSENTLDAVAHALARFEAYTKFRDFKAFHIEQAVAFKKQLADQDSKVTGDKLSKATLHATLAHLKRFFQWLAGQPGYKSRLRYSDAEYFNLSDKDTRVATARHEKNFPTMEQVKHVIANMPSNTEIEQRNRALVAFTLLTGARDSAIASMKLKHVDVAAASVLEMSGKDLAVLFIDVLHRSNPFALAVRVIAVARTLYHAKSLRDQFIRRKMIFLHVGFTVDVML